MAADHRIRQTRDWLRINGQPDATDEDATLELAQACGRMPGGSCSNAGSEYCDFECPFRDEDDEDDEFYAGDEERDDE